MKNLKQTFAKILLFSFLILSFSCRKSTHESLTDFSVKEVNTANNKIAAYNSSLNLLPKKGIAGGYYIVSKLSNRALTFVPKGAQIQQTDFLSPGARPSAQAFVSIAYFGTVSNPSHFPPGTYPTYKIQWGSLNPYTLNNQFWDVYQSSSADGTPVITWPSTYDAGNQRFVFTSTGDNDGSVYIRCLATGKYLQIAGNSFINKSSGAKLEVWGFNANLNQKFYIKK